MTIQELIEKDSSFNEALFLTKVNNIFVKFFTAIMTDKLPDVDHFISDKVYAYGENILLPLRGNNNRKMYDELNVKTSRIQSIILQEDTYVINVFLEARYMDYVLDLNTGNVVSGNDTSRVQVNYMLTFSKKVDSLTQGIVKKCPACGAPMNINNSGKCDYCGAIYNQQDYDWILDDIKIC